MTAKIIDGRPSDGEPYRCLLCGLLSSDPEDCTPGFYHAGRGEVRLICVDCCDASAEGQIPGFRSLLISDVAEELSRQGIPPWPNRDRAPVRGLDADRLRWLS